MPAHEKMILLALVIVIIIVIIARVAMDTPILEIQGTAIGRGTMQCDDPGTYTVFGNLGGFSRANLDDELQSHGLIRVPHPRRDEFITLVWTSQDAHGHFIPLSFHIPCLVKNVLDIETYSSIANKKYLHENMRMRERDVSNYHLAKSWSFATFKMPREQPHVFITRPAAISFFGGRGIFRVDTQKKLDEVAVIYRRMKLRFDNILVSEYLEDMYLYQGRKFHLRLYMIVRADPQFCADSAHWNLWRDEHDFHEPRGKILTAAKEYIRGDYDNTEVHDTHAKTTPGAIFFPTHANDIRAPWNPERDLDINAVYAQLDQICGALARLLEWQGVRPYRESKCAFDVFGLDVMIVRRATVDPCVILLEVNDRVGYDTPDSAMTKKFQCDYFKWVWERGIAPILTR